jgi:hypothetical protein
MRRLATLLCLMQWTPQQQQVTLRPPTQQL